MYFLASLFVIACLLSLVHIVRLVHYQMIENKSNNLQFLLMATTFLFTLSKFF